MNKQFWSKRYQENNTGWDIGYISTPIKEYIDQLNNTDIKILIPGAGNSYEAEYLFNKGFRNVYIVDVAKEPLKNFKKRLPDFPESQIMNEDFFNISGNYDLILEQTFFCAIPISERSRYAEKSNELLEKGGRIAGVLFNFDLKENGPPHGGSKEEYLTYFRPYFEIDILEPCQNSIKPRQGNELFFKFRKK